ncbi:MAG: cupin domain-containing protein [Ktedonobacteraceae bacterium]
MEKVRLSDKFALFEQHWTPKIVGELNDSYVLLAKLEGEFVWHKHDTEDELFLIVKGTLLIRLRDRDVHLEAGEFFIVPRGVEHLPIAEEGTQVLLLEPKTTKHTGDVISDRTVTTYERI